MKVAIDGYEYVVEYLAERQAGKWKVSTKGEDPKYLDTRHEAFDWAYNNYRKKVDAAMAELEDDLKEALACLDDIDMGSIPDDRLAEYIADAYEYIEGAIAHIKGE